MPMGTRVQQRDAAAALSPLRSEFLSIEGLEERARALAASHVIARPTWRRSNALGVRLHDNADVLRRAYRLIADDARRGEFVPPAAEWLLDNFHLIEAEIHQVRRDLPRRYYRELPKLASGDTQGVARVYALAEEIVRASDAKLDVDRLLRFEVAYQAIAPLSLGETWAWPSMLKVALLENLRRLAIELVEARSDRIAADAFFARAEATPPESPLPDLSDALRPAFVAALLQRIRESGPRVAELQVSLLASLRTAGTSEEEAIVAEQRQQASRQVSTANSITSLRLLATVDWNDLVERVSAIEEVLRRDPAGAYAQMDFQSRDRYRQAIEAIADRDGAAQVEVALRAIEQARSAAERWTTSARAAHVGYHLIGPGRQALEQMVGARTTVRRRIRRFAFRHATPLYLGAVAFGTAAGVVAAFVAARLAGGATWTHWVAGLLALIPASEFAIAVLQRVSHRLVRPRPLPRLEFLDGVPATARTIVVVPTFLVDLACVQELTEQLEIHALGNPDPHLHFALLTDFPDADTAEQEGEGTILAAAVAAVRALNVRYPLFEGDRFYLCHRARRWNPSEGFWMGWERKRGKLEEFNRLLRGAADTSFTTVVGDRSLFASIRYVLTLDSDTRLPRDAARRLVGVIEHPLHRPRVDPRTRRVVEGYGILQPRVSVTLTSAAGSLFARVYAGHTGVDPYSSAVSDTYQDLFHEGIFAGKGLYDVDAFTATLEGRVPENALLSHDLFEGIHARTAFVSDVEVVDDFPSSVLTHARRQHRWVRGDWQILAWLLPVVPTRRGVERSRLPIISRWKILDNLRRSLVAPALVGFLASAWTWLPGKPWAWTAAALWVLAFPLYPPLVRFVRGPRPLQPLRVFLHDVRDELATGAAQVLLQITLLAFHAYEVLHAIALTLVRMVVTQRRLLEWETAAAAAARAAGLAWHGGWRGFAREMWPASATAVVVAVIIGWTHRGAGVTAAPFLAAWFASPWIAWWLSRPVVPRRLVIDAGERALFRQIARKSWHYFERFATDEHHGLAPDNYQEVPESRVASRTSPTNIAMGLLGGLAAHDFGWIDGEELAQRTARTLDSIERLAMHRGHLLNWHDTRTLEPLLPHYVSMVDSGNLAGALWTLSAGLRQVAGAPVDLERRCEGARDTAYLLRQALTAARTAATAASAVPDLAWDDLQRDVDAIDRGLAGRDAASARLDRARERARKTFTTLDGGTHGTAMTRDARDWAARLVYELEHVFPADDRALAERLQSLASQADAIVAAMDFAFLYDSERRMFAVGFRLPDAEGPGRLDPSYYDLLATEARIGSFVAIAKGEVPQAHWFHLGRALAPVRGTPTLVSWGGTMFEYLMPLLIMRSYPETLLDLSCRSMVRAQQAYATRNAVPWGISESGYALTDRFGNYQYLTFGIPGLGLRRGLTDDLVIAPYASALAAMIDPAATAANFARLTEAGAEGRYGFYEAIDYTPRAETEEPEARGRIVRQYMAHHQGMTLLGLCNVVLGFPMVQRFHSNPAVQATELLLQERLPRHVPVIQPRPAEAAHVAPLQVPIPPRRFRSAQTPFPNAQFLSNGRLVTVVTNGGGGATTWDGLAVTRWREDATADPCSHALYLRDVRGGRVWSATYLPTAAEPDTYRVSFFPERAIFQRRDDGIETRLEIAISPEDDVEVRRLRIVNLGDRDREIELTSYVELCLGTAAEDLAHPAFGKLFLETEVRADVGALVCGRRRRRASDPSLWAFHVRSAEARLHGAVEWETDRARFIGRGRDLRDPQALDGRPLSGTTGAVLDPVFALRQRIRLPPGEFARLSFSTGVALDRDTALALAGKYADPQAASRTFTMVATQSTVALRHFGLTMDEAQLYERLASRILYADASLRAPALVRAANTLGQAGLWSFGISGDLPILLVRVVDGNDTHLVRQVLRAQEYWRVKGLRCDVVLLNENPGSYLDQMQDNLEALLRSGPWAASRDRVGGCFLLRTDSMAAAEHTLLLSVARAVLRGDRGTLADQIDTTTPDITLPPSRPRIADATASTDPAFEPTMPPLEHGNELGGFASSGREYAIRLRGDDETPLPWSLVLANPDFGSLVTASGTAFTWAVNSRENRLTPFANDPITESTAEAFYLRDEDTGRTWGATPGPLPRRPSDPAWIVRFAAGVARYEHARNGLRHRTTCFVDSEAPVKCISIAITNGTDRTRRISVFGYLQWALGPPRASEHLHVVTEYDPASRTILAHNAYAADFATRVAFFHASSPVESVTGDRGEFIGRNRSVARPRGLEAEGLGARFGAGLDPCAAMQCILTLEPDETREIVFVLGQGTDRAQALALVRRFDGQAEAAAALTRVEQHWDAILDRVRVHTPDDSFDLLTNRWLLYQTIAARLWGRTGFYQTSGAYGFRDQLQDVLALVWAAPDLLRQHLLRAAARQFVGGDVQHWWHAHSGRGVRTRCSDDLVWLPFATCHYVRALGDHGVLDEPVPFLDAPPLAPGEAEAYGQPTITSESATLYEHCSRALDRALTIGAHGLPLIGSGDWNDGMNEVGREGRGESVWLGFFLAQVLRDFAKLATTRGDELRAKRYRGEAARLAGVLEQAWDGAWYRRAYFDDGTPLGSAQNEECRIDSIAQAWAVLSQVAPAARGERALDAVRQQLVRRDAGLILLLAPPFDRSRQDPGYIKGYVPGVRENGGQYTHAALWVVMAVALSGSGDEATEFFHMLNPINHTRTRAQVARYRVEPYVVAADVYAHPMHSGRGGWTWYTGSAAWMYRAGIETILGIRRRGDELSLRPCVPASWPGFSVELCIGTSRYTVEVENPERKFDGVVEARLDGQKVDPDAIPLTDDGKPHRVHAVLGVVRAGSPTSARFGRAR